MNICMVGTGYVGLVSGACFAEMGHNVVCVDIDQSKIDNLQKGKIPIYEPGLEEIVVRNSEEGRLKFTTSLATGMEASQFVFIAVGTPPDEDGSADLRTVLAVARQAGQLMNSHKVVVNKSTVPVGTADLVKKAVFEELQKRKKTDIEFDVASNPEFLKEGDAINDFMRPDRIVVGVESERAATLMKDLYAPFTRNGHPILVMDVKSSELTKYASNAMLATRISFMNELSMLCDKVGGDIEEVRRGIGTDSRIGMPFLYSGLGYGGSCFPKDVQALVRTLGENKLPGRILEAVESVNKDQRKRFIDLVTQKFGTNLSGKTFGVWGLAFKPKTDDMREAPSVYVVKELHKMGAKVNVFDPVAMEVAKKVLPTDRVQFATDMYNAVEGSDGVLLVTEWSQFRNPDFEKMSALMKSKVFFDGRNQFQPEKILKLGWEYFCMGRGTTLQNNTK